MVKPKNCKMCELLAQNNGQYYCRIGCFYNNKTVLKYNVHSDCPLVDKKELTINEAVEILYSIFIDASVKERKLVIA